MEYLYFLKFPKSSPPDINKPLTTIPNINNVHKIPKQKAQLPMKNEYFYNKDFGIAFVVEDILWHILWLEIQELLHHWIQNKSFSMVQRIE